MTPASTLEFRHQLQFLVFEQGTVSEDPFLVTSCLLHFTKYINKSRKHGLTHTFSKKTLNEIYYN